MATDMLLFRQPMYRGAMELEPYGPQHAHTVVRWLSDPALRRLLGSEDAEFTLDSELEAIREIEAAGASGWRWRRIIAFEGEPVGDIDFFLTACSAADFCDNVNVAISALIDSHSCGEKSAGDSAHISAESSESSQNDFESVCSHINGVQLLVAEVNIMVPEVRRRGLGRAAMLKATESLLEDIRAQRIAKGHACDAVVFKAVVKSDNAAGAALFKSLGYSAVRQCSVFGETHFLGPCIAL